MGVLDKIMKPDTAKLRKRRDEAAIELDTVQTEIVAHAQRRRAAMTAEDPTAAIAWRAREQQLAERETLLSERCRGLSEDLAAAEAQDAAAAIEAQHAALDAEGEKLANEGKTVMPKHAEPLADYYRRCAEFLFKRRAFIGANPGTPVVLTIGQRLCTSAAGPNDFELEANIPAFTGRGHVPYWEGKSCTGQFGQIGRSPMVR